MSIQDGSVVWQKDFLMGLRKLPLVIGYNHKETYTSSGTFTPTMTGLYKITLQGGGGGGGGVGVTSTNNAIMVGGGGGGQGGHYEFYANLTAGTSYAFTIGAGGNGGSSGSSSNIGGWGTAGGATSITIGTDVYTASGGDPGRSGLSSGAYNFGACGGQGGIGRLNGTAIPGTKGASGGVGHTGKYSDNITIANGEGGGQGGNNYWDVSAYYGGGGAGEMWVTGKGVYSTAKGGDGYVTIEWFDPADAFPMIWAELEPST